MIKSSLHLNLLGNRANIVKNILLFTNAEIGYYEKSIYEGED